MCSSDSYKTMIFVRLWSRLLLGAIDMNIINIPWAKLLWPRKQTFVYRFINFIWVICLKLGPEACLLCFIQILNCQKWGNLEILQNILHLTFNRLILLKKKGIDIHLCTSHKSLVSPAFCCCGLVVVSSASPVPHNTNKTVKNTRCAMLRKLKRATP